MPQKRISREKRDFLPAIFSAGAVFLLCWLIFWIKDYAPFGTGTLATEDAHIQYADFYAYYKDLFSGKNSIFYTLSNTLGGDTLALVTYYLCSPFNLLLLLFDKSDYSSFFHLALSLKLSLCAFTMAYFLKERFAGLSRLFVFLLSVCYGLMQYNIAQSSNLMWLDGVYMLPLMILGIHRIFQSKNILLLSVSTAVCILFNWYAAGIACLFTIVWFAFEGISFLAEGGKFTACLRLLLRYIAGMAIAVLIGAVLFFPSVYALLGGKGAGNLPVLSKELMGSFLSVIRRYHLGALSERGAPSLFCGSLPLIGCIAYFFTRAIPRKQRLITLGLLVFMLCIYFFEPLYLVFSLLNYALSYYYRYSFITIFAIIYIAAGFYSTADRRSLRTAFFCAAGFTALFLLIELTDRQITNLRLMGTVAALLGCGGLLLLLGRFGKGRKLLPLALAALVLAELGMNTMLLTTSYHNYLDDFQSNYHRRQQVRMDQLRDYDPGVYRISQNAYRYGAGFNESLAYGFGSNACYTSCPDNRQLAFLDLLGYRTEAACMTIANTTILAADALLGVKYTLSDMPVNGLIPLEGFTETNGKLVYQNPYCLPMAFTIDSFTPEEAAEDSFAYHESLLSALYGSRVSIYRQVSYDRVIQDDTIVCTLTLPQGNFALYGNIPFIPGGNYALDVNGSYVVGYGGWRSMSLFYIPTETGDSTATVSFTTDEYQQFGNPQFFALDLDVLSAVTGKIRAGALEDVTIGTDKVSFEVTAEDASHVVLSIPVSDGWRIRINGKETQPLMLGECLTVLPLEAGSNRITMDYRIPFLDVGIVCSLLGVGLLVLWCRLEKKKKP